VQHASGQAASELIIAASRGRCVPLASLEFTMKYGVILALASVIDQCPPRLFPFQTHRYDEGSGWVHSTGGVAKETYTIEVDYRDNRKENTYVFQSEGKAYLTNLRDKPNFIKYRHKVNLPLGTYHVNKHGDYYEVCADHGKVTLSLKTLTFPENPSIVPWSYSVVIEPFGDLNKDGCVNGWDLGLFFSGWGVGGVTDFNSDGITDSEDLAILLLNWNPC